MRFDKAQQNIKMDQIPRLPNEIIFFQVVYTWRMLSCPVMWQICSFNIEIAVCLGCRRMPFPQP